MSITSVLPLCDQKGDGHRHFCLEHRRLSGLLPAATTTHTKLAVFVHPVMTRPTWRDSSFILRLELCRCLTAGATFTSTRASAITSGTTLVSVVEALAAWSRAAVILDAPGVARVLARPWRSRFVRIIPLPVRSLFVYSYKPHGSMIACHTGTCQVILMVLQGKNSAGKGSKGRKRGQQGCERSGIRKAEPPAGRRFLPWSLSDGEAGNCIVILVLV